MEFTEWVKDHLADSKSAGKGITDKDLGQDKIIDAFISNTVEDLAKLKGPKLFELFKSIPDHKNPMGFIKEAFLTHKEALDSSDDLVKEAIHLASMSELPRVLK